MKPYEGFKIRITQSTHSIFTDDRDQGRCDPVESARRYLEVVEREIRRALPGVEVVTRLEREIINPDTIQIVELTADWQTEQHVGDVARDIAGRVWSDQARRWRRR